MKYILSVILSVFSCAVIADDNLTLYYEANGQCSEIYATPPTNGCNGQSVSSIELPSEYDSSFVGYYTDDGVQVIDQNGNVNPYAATMLSAQGKGGAEQQAEALFTSNGGDSIDYGPWNIYFYGGTNTGVPLKTMTYRRSANWTPQGQGSTTRIYIWKYEHGIEHGVVHGWCENPNSSTWSDATCFTDYGDACISGCEGTVMIQFPHDVSGDKNLYAWLDCERGYQQEGYKCVAKPVEEEEQVSQAECAATDGIWDGEYCRYLLHWNGGQCNEYQDTYYIAGRKNYVRCGSSQYWNVYPGGKLMGWCLDSGRTHACSDDTYGSIVIPANARGDIDLYAKVACAVGFQYNSSTAACDRLGEDWGKLTMNYVCDSSQLWGCNTAAQCSSNNGVWNSDNHMCASHSYVNANGGSMWPTHDCNADRTCVGMERTPQEECTDNGGEWGADNKCRYRIIFVQNVAIPYQYKRPECDTTYIAGETTQVTCDTMMYWGTFAGWCLDDQLKSACNSSTPIADRKTVTIPADAKGNLVYYAKWDCETYDLIATGNCARASESIDYVCNSDDTSGCMNNTECTVAGGTWDDVAGICYKFDTFGVADKNITIYFTCGSSLRNSNYPLPSLTGKVGDLIETPNAYEYCEYGNNGNARNFAGWVVNRGYNVDNAALLWDAEKTVRIPKSNESASVAYNVMAQWSRGDEHGCPDQYWKGLDDNGHPIDEGGTRWYSGIHLSTAGSAENQSIANGYTSGCPRLKCGDEHYYGDWSSCTVNYPYSTHRKFTGWCKNQNWTTGCSANPFAQYYHTSQFWDDGNNYYDKYTCVDGWTLNNSTHECVCNTTKKPITFVTDGTIGSNGLPHGLSNLCPTESCGDTPLTSYPKTVTGGSRPTPACNVANIPGNSFVSWCLDAERTNCPDDLVFTGGSTYYAKFKCTSNYHMGEDGFCVKN